MRNLIVTITMAFSLVLGAAPAVADHQDGSDTTASPSTDIANVYAWMHDSDTMNLIMTVFPDADSNSKFSSEAKYIFHINNSAAYGEEQTKTTIECYFSETGRVTCEKDGSTILVNNVNANIPGTTGVGNNSGTFQIITRLARDPSFRDIENFDIARAAQRQDNSSTSNDTAQCNALSVPTRTSLLNTYEGESGGETGTNETPVNAYADQNILAISIQADTSVIGDGPVYGVSGTTEKYIPAEEEE